MGECARCENCPICLEPMFSTDHDHPLQCDRHCGYNFCKNCVESFIASSKDNFRVGSDGNCHVKVYLHCPNCRSDLSTSIRSTLLLRKVDELRVLHARSEDNAEDKLTPAQRQFKQFIKDRNVRAAIRNARKLEAAYRSGRRTSTCVVIDDETRNDGDDPSVDHEEVGVELDLERGVMSFREPGPPIPVERKRVEFTVDPSLFAGLDYFLSDEEKEVITELMTSGETWQLAEAAQIFHLVMAQHTKRHKNLLATNGYGTTNTNRQSKHVRQHHLHNHRLPFISKSRLEARRNRNRCTVLELISEAQVAHEIERQKRGVSGRGGSSSSRLPLQAADMNVSTNSHERLAAEKRTANIFATKGSTAQFQKQFPLPVRMPRCVEINLSEPFEFQLSDFEWDGTVRDAYSKITVSFRGYMEQRRCSNRNVQTVLGGNEDIRIEMPRQPRVAIHSVGVWGISNRQYGFKRGDVITHISGQSVENLNARQVIMKLKTMQQHHHRYGRARQPKMVLITLNAERSVAEALKRRAMALEELFS